MFSFGPRLVAALRPFDKRWTSHIPQENQMNSAVIDKPASKNIDDLRINGDRLWASLMELAKIGATPKGGVCRLTLTDLDKQGRDLVISWAREAGPGASPCPGSRRSRSRCRRRSDP